MKYYFEKHSGNKYAIYYKDRNGLKWYFSRIRNGSPVFYCDHTYANLYLLEAAQKKREWLKTANR